MVGVMGSPGGSSKEVEKKGLGSGGVLLGAALVLGFTLWTTHLDGYWLARHLNLEFRTATAPSQLQLPTYLERPWENKTMPDDALARGVTYQGTGEALMDFARNLVLGEQAHVVFVGGSVTFGRGASDFDMAYPALFTRWVQRNFPPANHTFTNSGLSGTTSGLPASCTAQLIPEDASLVIIEYTMNDVRDLKMHHPSRVAFEKLLRKLLRRPRPPAVLLLHHWCWWQGFKTGLQSEDPRGLYDEPDTELDLTLIGQYYDVPSVSLRAAAWRLMTQMQGQWAPVPMGPHAFFVDPCHPSNFGHQALADLAIDAVQKAAARVQEQQLLAVGFGPAADDGPAGGLQEPPPQRGKSKRAEMRRRKQLQMHGRHAAAPAAAAAQAQQQQQQQPGGQQGQETSPAWFPPPLQKGVADNMQSALCVLGDDFQGVVVNASGFQWKPDKPEAKTRPEQKWSWSTDKLGDWAELQIDTTGGAPEPQQGADGNATAATGAPAAGAGAGGSDDSQPILYLGHLKSYKGMGLASVRCVSGCTCDVVWVDSLWDRPVSIVQAEQIKVTRHKDCRIRVTVIERPAESRNATGEPAAGRVVLRNLVVDSAPLVLAGER